MAKIQANKFDSSFDILEHGSVTEPGGAGIILAMADSANMVFVRVQNNSRNAASFTAQISAFNGSAIGPSQMLTPEDATNAFYSGCVLVGRGLSAVLSGTPNRTVTVKKNGISPGNHLDFEAVTGGSGCSASGSVASASASGSMYAAARPAALARAGNPVPVALSLQVDAPAESADPDADHLNRPTTLRFSNSSAEECCWLSQPIDACSDRSSPAFWMLRTGDARTWVLILRRGDADVVVYHLTAPPTKGTPFPLRMRLAGGGAWPRTVTVSPAP